MLEKTIAKGVILKSGVRSVLGPAVKEYCSSIFFFPRAQDASTIHLSGICASDAPIKGHSDGIGRARNICVPRGARLTRSISISSSPA